MMRNAGQEELFGMTLTTGIIHNVVSGGGPDYSKIAFQKVVGLLCKP